MKIVIIDDEIEALYLFLEKSSESQTSNTSFIATIFSES